MAAEPDLIFLGLPVELHPIKMCLVNLFLKINILSNQMSIYANKGKKKSCQ
jgi:hypothetical protein